MAAPLPPVRVACQQESGSESDFELDSPPHLIMIEDEEWDTTSMSPSASPPSPTPSVDRGPPVFSTFGSDIEEWHSSDDQEDPYFESLMDNEDPYFESLMDNLISAFGDVCKSTLPAEDTIYKERSHQQQSDEYAASALKHYNNCENNKVKYELIDAVTSGGMMDMNDGYGHVNFTAKADQKNSKEELFFAELRFHHNTYITTCVLSLEGEKSIGGLCGSKYDNRKNGLFIDAKHCYACGFKNGELYEAGHVADSEYCHDM